MALGALPRFGVAALLPCVLVDFRSLLERRRIAFTKAQTARLWLAVMRLQQGIAAGGMGFNDQVARQQFSGPDVRNGSKPDMTASISDVRFTPKSGHR
jgi:hypothetical protein